jgi:inosose dehydratase
MKSVKDSSTINRRHFLQTSVFGSTALLAATLPKAVLGGTTKPQHVPDHGLKLGIASYSLRKFTLDQAIAMTKQAGVKYITLKDVHLPLKSTPDQRKEVHQKIEAAGLVLMGGGVIYMKNDEKEVRNIFDYAKDAGMPTIVCSPDPDALDTVEKTAKEYDLRIAIHNHGPGDARYPSALDVLRLIKDRDAHMGICIDAGHTVRLGEDPLDAIHKCASRLYDFHIKDVTAANATSKATEVGKGVIDIVGVLQALVEMKFPYHVALEYESYSDAPMPGVLESFAYMRGVLAAI